MGDSDMKVSFRQLRDRCAQLVEKQGFPIIVTVCVCVMTAAALWTKQQEAQPLVPALPTRDVSAAQLLQETLEEAATPSPVPTMPPRTFSPPLTEYTLLTAFSATTMHRSGMTGVWAIHDAADLQSPLGSPVQAIGDGVVADQGKDQLRGAWIHIDHGDGIEAIYAGLERSSSFMVGDEVRAGDILGYVGVGLMAESDLPPHLHLRMTRCGTAIDPLTLWE